uniref:Candidate secreted effector n=1 Tax=Meloidogyne incognita TaxID=6306 RepID=A0A914MKU1_MELIC
MDIGSDSRSVGTSDVSDLSGAESFFFLPPFFFFFLPSVGLAFDSKYSFSCCLLKYSLVLSVSSLFAIAFSTLPLNSPKVSSSPLNISF